MGEKEEYLQRVEAKLADLEGQIGIVKTKAEKGRAETREEYHEQFEKLRSRHQKVGERLKELAKANEETWRDHQPAIEGALSELQHALRNILFRIG
jgi:chromosome segregation ATPase